jgi:hypothetical protein
MKHARDVGALGLIQIPTAGTGSPRPPTVLLAYCSHFCSIGLRARPSLCSSRRYMLAVATAGARVVYQRCN